MVSSINELHSSMEIPSEFALFTMLFCPDDASATLKSTLLNSSSVDFVAFAIPCRDLKTEDTVIDILGCLLAIVGLKCATRIMGCVCTGE